MEADLDTPKYDADRQALEDLNQPVLRSEVKPEVRIDPNWVLPTDLDAPMYWNDKDAATTERVRGGISTPQDGKYAGDQPELDLSAPERNLLNGYNQPDVPIPGVSRKVSDALKEIVKDQKYQSPPHEEAEKCEVPDELDARADRLMSEVTTYLRQIGTRRADSAYSNLADGMFGSIHSDLSDEALYLRIRDTMAGATALVESIEGKRNAQSTPAAEPEKETVIASLGIEAIEPFDSSEESFTETGYEGGLQLSSQPSKSRGVSEPSKGSPPGMKKLPNPAEGYEITRPRSEAPGINRLRWTAEMAAGTTSSPIDLKKYFPKREKGTINFPTPNDLSGNLNGVGNIVTGATRSNNDPSHGYPTIEEVLQSGESANLGLVFRSPTRVSAQHVYNIITDSGRKGVDQVVREMVTMGDVIGSPQLGLEEISANGGSLDRMLVLGPDRRYTERVLSDTVGKRRGNPRLFELVYALKLANNDDIAEDSDFDLAGGTFDFVWTILDGSYDSFSRTLEGADNVMVGGPFSISYTNGVISVSGTANTDDEIHVFGDLVGNLVIVEDGTLVYDGPVGGDTLGGLDTTSVVPEAATVGLGGSGLIALYLLRGFRRRKGELLFLPDDPPETPFDEWGHTFSREFNLNTGRWEVHNY